MLKRILLVVVAIFIIIQFIRPERNIHPEPQTAGIMNMYPASEQVKGILKKACYDCHSNNTRYPWYNNIQPVAWWLNSHVRDGKGHLNYDEFLNYPPSTQLKKLKGTAKLVKGGQMPLSSYLWIHKDAKLTDQEKSAIVSWADSTAQKISTGGANVQVDTR